MTGIAGTCFADDAPTTVAGTSEKPVIAQGADLAEYIGTVDSTIGPGDVVCIDTSRGDAVIKTSYPYDYRVFGVVSTAPGFLGGNPSTGAAGGIKLALAGRVPTNVTNENGPIYSGDYLTTSSTPGYAMKATKAGSVIGIAMESMLVGKGSVLMFIKPGWFNGVYGKGTALAGTLTEGTAIDSEKITWKGTIPKEAGGYEDTYAVSAVQSAPDLSLRGVSSMDSQGTMNVAESAAGDVHLFSNSKEGQNRELILSGYDMEEMSVKKGYMYVDDHGTFTLSSDAEEKMALEGEKGLSLNAMAHGPVELFASAKLGDNPQMKIHGYNSTNGVNEAESASMFMDAAGSFNIINNKAGQSIKLARTGQVDILDIGYGDVTMFMNDETNVTHKLKIYDGMQGSAQHIAIYHDGFSGNIDTTFGSMKINGVNQDYAEWCNADPALDEDGTVVAIDGAKDEYFVATTQPYQTNVGGVLVKEPGFLIGKPDQNNKKLALSGRVPILVTDEGGPIQRGDILVSSGTPGHAMKGDPSKSAGCVVGKALQNHEKGKGKIRALISMQ